MKKSFILAITLLLICSFAVFAEGTYETVADKVSEVTGSVQTNKIIKDYTKKLESFQSEYEKLSATIQMAYEKNDVDKYLEAKKALRSLEVPYMTEEETNLALEQIVASNDTESAQLLYQYSRYYQPVLTFEAKDAGFNYHSTLSVMPGSDVTLPELRTFNKAMLFKGWGTQEGVVSYAAGETIQMPLKDTTFYAVFEADPSVVTGASVEFTVEDTIKLQKNKQTDVSFNIKNNGTENLTDVEVLLESDDPLLVVLNEKLTARFIESCAERTANYTVITKAPVGTELKAVITVKDANNNIWTKNITFCVE